MKVAIRAILHASFLILHLKKFFHNLLYADSFGFGFEVGQLLPQDGGYFIRTYFCHDAIYS